MIHELAREAWPKIGDAPLVIIPIGSTEQHGPHLPLDVDTRIADAVAHGLADRLDEHDGRPIVITPALAFGASGEHQAFAGTSSIGENALTLVVIELVRSVDVWAGDIVIVNGHGGNIRSLASAISQLRYEKHSVAWLPCAVTGGDAHAGRTETSLMLWLDPGRVDVALAAPGNVESMTTLLPLLRDRGTRALSPTGVLGDPTGASAAEGRVLLDRMIAGAVRRVVAATVDDRGCLVDPVTANE